MSSNVSSKKGSTKACSEGNWEGAIRATEQEILKIKARHAGLRSALRVFRDRQAKGDPFPSEKLRKRLLGQDSDL